MPTLLSLAMIQVDPGVQSRLTVDPQYVQDLKEALDRGEELPPLDVFQTENADYWLADGFHRLEAFKLASRQSVPVNLHQGTRRNAILFSVSANIRHGLRLTNADKRRAVLLLLQDEEWSKWSSREIARRCGVSHRFVDNLRQNTSGYDSQIDKRLVIRNGVTYEQNIANIGPNHHEYIKEHAPTRILRRVLSGELSVRGAFELTKALESVSEKVRSDCIVADVSDPALVTLLETKQQTKSYAEVMTTGFIQPGDENEAVPICKATARDFQRYLDEKRREHYLASIELQRAKQNTLMQSERAVVTKIEENYITLRFANADLTVFHEGQQIVITAMTKQEGGYEVSDNS